MSIACRNIGGQGQVVMKVVNSMNIERDYRSQAAKPGGESPGPVLSSLLF